MGDWRWLTRYDPRRPSGRDLLLERLGDGRGFWVVLPVVFLASPLVWRVAGDRGWPAALAVHLAFFLACMAASAAVERAARRRLVHRRGSRRRPRMAGPPA
jgi:hypothetical protein